ncbi:MAG: hypothetical protein U0795_13665 [Pirellulales bacterium]
MQIDRRQLVAAASLLLMGIAGTVLPPAGSAAHAQTQASPKAKAPPTAQAPPTAKAPIAQNRGTQAPTDPSQINQSRADRSPQPVATTATRPTAASARQATAAYQQWLDQFQERLIQLAGEGVPNEPIAQLLVPRLSDRTVVFVPQLLGGAGAPVVTGRRRGGPASGAADGDASGKAAWPEPLREAVEQGADELLELARHWAADQPSLANRWLHEVLFLRPDHPELVQLIGGKATAVETVRSPRNRSDWGWAPSESRELRSPNFQLLTNAPADVAESLLGELELVQAVWGQLYYDWCRHDGALVDRLADPKRRVRVLPRMRAVLFATREEYLRGLRAEVPQIDVTRGYYSEARQTAFFYASDGESSPAELASSWRHEAVHQLFHQRRVGRSQAVQQQGICLLEGVAMHMESLRGFPGYVTVGGIEATRLQSARAQTLIDGRLVSWAELSGLGKQSLQDHPDIRALYTAAAGWAHFWLDHPDPAYRRAYLEAIDQLYAGKPWQAGETAEARASTDGAIADGASADGASADGASADGASADGASADGASADAAGVTGADLDRRYVQFLKVTDAQLLAVSLIGGVDSLMLGRTAVTDAGLKELGRLVDLQSLDLQGTSVTDAGLAEVGRLRKLREINLAGTRVTDVTLRRLEGLDSLLAAEVEGTATSDAARARLSELLNRRQSQTPE